MSAIISPCGRYRYRLGRQLPPRSGAMHAGSCLFIMLNPSTADDATDDPTIRKCIKYATRWGYARVNVVNLFAWRATDPNELIRVGYDPIIGIDNDEHIKDEISDSALVVGAWGDGGGSRRALEMIKRRVDDGYLRPILEQGKLHRLGPLTAAGNPRHPLYLASNLKPEPMP